MGRPFLSDISANQLRRKISDALGGGRSHAQGGETEGGQVPEQKK